MFNRKILVYFLYLVFLISCNKNPSNLNVEVNIYDDNSGYVELIARADNSTSYDFFPGDDTADVPYESRNGQFNHSYKTTGTYTIEVRAYGKSGKYEKFEQQINVTVLPIDLTNGQTSPLSYDGMSLIWQDEFNGDALETSYWTHEIGTGNNGWGNNELQYYREENTTVHDGYLTIEAKEENYEGRIYTSSRINTKGKQSFKYGRIDIRAKLPKGKGIWPALWMLGDTFPTVGWPFCGEIDIMEMIGGETNDGIVHGTVHWDNNGQYASYGGGYTNPSGIFYDEFYVFSIVWTSESIIWYVNDIQYHIIDITPEELSELHNSSFLIFNVAVGGNWPGSPDNRTIFPQRMYVDYVRVFQSS